MIQKAINYFLLLFIFPTVMMAQELQPLTLTGHKSGVNVCSFSPDGKTLISGSKDGALKVWDVTQNYKVIKEFSMGNESITALHYNHKGDKISIGSLECLQIYNSSNFKRIAKKKKAHATYVKSGNFSPDDQFIVSSSWKDNALVVWESSSLKQVIEFAEPIWTDEASFTPDGNFIISGNHDNYAKVWDVKTGNIVRTLAGHTDWIYSVKVTSDMKTIFTGSFDQTLKGWDFNTGKLLFTLTGHKEGIASMALSPDNRWLASASVDGVLIIWDVESKQEKHKLTQGGPVILYLEYSPDGKSLVSCNFDGTLRVWNLSNLQ